MLQEDSNGESSFEIIDKKNQLVTNNEKTESVSTLSSLSSAHSLPSPDLSTRPSGNLLSNVVPPTPIPDFTLCWPSSGISSNTASATLSQTLPSQTQVTLATDINPLPSEQFPNTEFSAAIPPSKGVPHGVQQAEVIQNESASGGLMGLFKEAFASGVLSKVAEKAKNSVDSIITTLDPQMSEYIYSGGDTEITVTSENNEDVGAIREAFHNVFGKVWVNGIKLNLPPKDSLPVGFELGIKYAEEKIAYSLKFRNTPTIAIEDILLEQGDNWYALSLLILKDPTTGIKIQTFSQGTPVPVNEVLKEISRARPELMSLPTKDKLAAYLQTKPEWQSSICGIDRKEILLLAGKAVVKMYKNQLSLFKK